MSRRGAYLGGHTIIKIPYNSSQPPLAASSTDVRTFAQPSIPVQYRHWPGRFPGAAYGPGGRIPTASRSEVEEKLRPRLVNVLQILNEKQTLTSAELIFVKEKVVGYINKIDYILSITGPDQNHYQLYMEIKYWLDCEPVVIAMEAGDRAKGRIGKDVPSKPHRKKRRKVKKLRTPTQEVKTVRGKVCLGTDQLTDESITRGRLAFQEPTAPIPSIPSTYDTILATMRKTASSEEEAVRRTKALLRHLGADGLS